MKKIILLILPLLLLTGCYNYRELNELAIATAVEVDKIDNEFHLLVQVANPKNPKDASSSNNQSSYDYTFTTWTKDQTGTLPAIFTP